MTKVNVHEAKSQLSKLLEKAMRGEEVVIAKSGKPMVRLVPIIENRKDWWGMDEGKGWIADDFDDLPEDILAAFYGEDEETNTD
ncbi:MAG: type II toxin-antitoxin system prevent-host-death family antitoxin [Pyrinomonadaceae bacterium]